MQIQDGATAKLVGYQMEHGHHGAVVELPEGGIVESPRAAIYQDQPAPPSGPVMSETSTGYRPLPAEEFDDDGEVKTKVMNPPEPQSSSGVQGAETE